MNHRVWSELDVYEEEHSVVLIGDGLSVEFRSVASGPVRWEVTDNVFCLDLNEVSAHYLNGFVTGEQTPVETSVSVRMYTTSDAQFIKGIFDNLPGYSPFYGVTDEGIYRIQWSVKDKDYSDSLLDVQTTENDILVENVETGVTLPHDAEEVKSWFSDEVLEAVVKVVN